MTQAWDKIKAYDPSAKEKFGERMKRLFVALEKVRSSRGEEEIIEALFMAILFCYCLQETRKGEPKIAELNTMWHRYLYRLDPNGTKSDDKIDEPDDGSSDDEYDSHPTTTFIIVRTINELAQYFTAGETIFWGVMRAGKQKLSVRIEGVEEDGYHASRCPAPDEIPTFDEYLTRTRSGAPELRSVEKEKLAERWEKEREEARFGVHGRVKLFMFYETYPERRRQLLTNTLGISKKCCTTCHEFFAAATHRNLPDGPQSYTFSEPLESPSRSTSRTYTNWAALAPITGKHSARAKAQILGILEKMDRALASQAHQALKRLEFENSVVKKSILRLCAGVWRGMVPTWSFWVVFALGFE